MSYTQFHFQFTAFAVPITLFAISYTFYENEMLLAGTIFILLGIVSFFPAKKLFDLYEGVEE